MLTTLTTIAFPAFDPVALAIGPLVIRWYALAYITGLVLGWRLILRFAAKPGSPIRPQEVDDLLVWITLGVILGGRIGYVLFYNLPIYAAHPLLALEVWKGGMSFHGGMLGVLVAMILFGRQNKIPFMAIGDLVTAVAPIGLFFGRIANFVNGELWGRTTDVPWAMIFPRDPTGLPRHPSQLYEAATEGLLLFIVMMVLEARGARNRMGLMGGCFLLGYACARIGCEFFREPDIQIGYLTFGLTEGQLLSIPMAAAGIALILTAKRRGAPPVREGLRPTNVKITPLGKSKFRS